MSQTRTSHANSEGRRRGTATCDRTRRPSVRHSTDSSSNRRSGATRHVPLARKRTGGFGFTSVAAAPGKRQTQTDRTQVAVGGSIGFTLLELLIVLGLLTGILALAWPSMQRRVEKSEIQSSVVSLREAIHAARMAAIQSGEIYILEFERGQSSVRLFPLFASPATEETTTVGRNSQPATAVENSDTTQTFEFAADVVYLPASDAMKIAKQFNADSNSDQTIELDFTVGAAEADQSRPAPANANSQPAESSAIRILFFPNGRCQGKNFALFGLRSKFFVDVTFDENRGSIQLGPLLRAKDVIVKLPSSEESDSESEAADLEESEFESTFSEVESEAEFE